MEVQPQNGMRKKPCSILKAWAASCNAGPGICGHRGNAYLESADVRERAMPPSINCRKLAATAEQVPPANCTATRQALDRLAQQPIQPVVTRTSNTACD